MIPTRWLILAPIVIAIFLVWFYFASAEFAVGLGLCSAWILISTVESFYDHGEDAWTSRRNRIISALICAAMMAFVLVDYQREWRMVFWPTVVRRITSFESDVQVAISHEPRFVRVRLERTDPFKGQFHLVLTGSVETVGDLDDLKTIVSRYHDEAVGHIVWRVDIASADAM